MDATASKPRRRWPWLLLVATLFCPCLALIPLGLDEDPPDDADLLEPAPAIAAEENAYAELMGLVAASPDEGEPAVFRDRVAALLWQGRLQPPVPTTRDEARGEGLDPPGTRLWSGGRVALEEGRGPEALRYALTLLLFGVRRQKDPRGAADWTRGIEDRGLGEELFVSGLALSELDEVELARLDERLGILEGLDRREALTEARRAEYRNMVLFEEIAPKRLAVLVDRLNVEVRVASALADTPLERFVYKPNRTRRRQVAALRRRLAGLEPEGLPPEFRDDGFLLAAISGNYGLWEVAWASRHPSCTLGSSPRPPIPDELKRARARVNLQCLRILVAIRRFQGAEGRPPQTLSELRPRFLKAVPKDLDGAPIRYRPERELIYSVGPDLQDDEASESDRAFSFARR